MARPSDFATESQLTRVRRARRIGRELEVTYPQAHCEIDFDSPFQLLVGAILSAQTTDRRVNGVTPTLFDRYPGPVELAGAKPEDVEEILRPIGFFRAKAQRIIALAADLEERFDGRVPSRMDELVTLPGVGRKTANVVLGEAFGVPGITVDTHVGRLSRRWRLTEHSDPVKVEADLGALFAKSSWTRVSQLIIWHGRRRCHAQRPACGACPVARWCPAFGEGPTDEATAATLVRTQGAA